MNNSWQIRILRKCWNNTEYCLVLFIFFWWTADQECSSEMFLNNFLIKENKTQYKNDMTIVPRILFSPRMEFFNVNFSVPRTLIINQYHGCSILYLQKSPVSNYNQYLSPFFIPRPSTFADSPVSVSRTVQFDTSPSTSLRWDLLLSNGFVINDFSRKKLKEVLRKHLEFWWVAISSFWFNVKKVKIIQTPRICQTHRDSSVQSSFASKKGNFTSHNHFQFEIPFFPHYTPRYEPPLTQVQK